MILAEVELKNFIIISRICQSVRLETHFLRTVFTQVIPFFEMYIIFFFKKKKKKSPGLLV